MSGQVPMTAVMASTMIVMVMNSMPSIFSLGMWMQMATHTETQSNSIQACEQPGGYTDNTDDCDDTDPNTGVWYADNDNDGFGDPNHATHP